MNSNNSILLAEKFPDFKFASEADDFLANIQGKSVHEQLKERHVHEVKIIPLIISGGGLGIEEDGKIFINISKFLEPESQVDSFGHEIAHTFNLCFDEELPVAIFPEDCLYEMNEEFCREFSRRWVTINGLEYLVTMMKNQSMIIFQHSLGPFC